MRFTAVLSALVVFLFPGFGTASAAQNGNMTWYDDSGYGACGTQINAKTQMLVAVPKSWFTNSNPNKDPICKKSVRVTYKGKTITVPVRDMCPSCARTHLDLSKPAFGALANHDLGNVSGVTWDFVG